MDVESGTIVGEKYLLERPLSRGGMGSVWVARHVQLGAPVAIKFMDPEHAASPEFRARFYREARTAANLGSPHVVSVQDYGIQGTVPYLVMELLRGEDLSRRLKRVRRVPLSEAARIALQTGKALRRAHESGLVHRDLKPGNLFLARVDEDEEIVKVLDFGIAKQLTGKLLSDETTKTGELLGSPFYMSPEQARSDKDLDARSDLWSLGVILFRAVTGRLPFEGDVLGAVLSKILVEPIPQPTQIAPDLPANVDAFFVRALARDRAQRFQSAHEMVHAFVAAAGDVGVPLPAPSAPRQAPSTSRTGTLLGLSPGGTAEPERPGDLGALSWSEADAPRSQEAAQTPLPDPFQPGTLTAAAAVDVCAPRKPRASGTRRWLLACAALSVVSGAAAITALRPVGEERAAPALAPVEPPIQHQQAAERLAPPPVTAPPPVEVTRVTLRGAAVVAVSESAAQAAAPSRAAPAEPPAVASPAAPARPMPRRLLRQSDVVDPWQRK
ncbi:protein kinase [Sorangium cellulosum]|uniref:Protein kinase n=1 Tax=Sorangium cellulosum TaxID=56 RepID=A0A2L0EZY4_SORCE|nr:serine/threonine-protein kinase [Sorangium cellulosum]AUX44845.1 protein kinase [Sorangium cellulosum]